MTTGSIDLQRVGGRLQVWLPAIASLVVLLVAWWAFTTYSDVEAFLLPPPDQVLTALFFGVVQPNSPQASFVLNLATTLQSAAVGFVLGTAAGLILATLAATSRLAGRVIMPYAAALQALPKIALAPLLVLWFGFGIQSKIVLVALIVFFVVLVNTYRGLKETDPLLLDVLRSMGASRWQVIREVQFPFALPFVFAGLSVGVINAMLGAIAGEFVGARSGMGVLLILYQYQNNAAAVFAALITLAIVGVAISAGMELIRRRVVFWSSDVR